MESVIGVARHLRILVAFFFRPPAPCGRVRSRQCQGFPRNPGRFHPGSGL